MTLAEFQPHVERAIAVVEKATAGDRRLNLLKDELAKAQQALAIIDEIGPKIDTFECPHCGGICCTHIRTLIDQREDLIEMVGRIQRNMKEAINSGEISELPLRAVPIDLITEAVVRRIMRVPPAFPILRLNVILSDAEIERAVFDLSQKWRTARGQTGEEATHVVNAERVVSAE